MTSPKTVTPDQPQAVPDALYDWLCGWLSTIDNDEQQLGARLKKVPPVEIARQAWSAALASTSPAPPPALVAGIANAGRRFMDLFVADGEPPFLSCEDIDPQELAARYDALASALSVTSLKASRDVRDGIQEAEVRSIVERLRVGFDEWTPDPTYDLRQSAADILEQPSPLAPSFPSRHLRRSCGRRYLTRPSRSSGLRS